MVQIQPGSFMMGSTNGDADEKPAHQVSYESARAGGANPVLRGGSWNNNATNLRSANRNHNTPNDRNNNIGFRVVAVDRTQQSQSNAN